MKNLGAQFLEARKAKGVTLRDAADVTKIRADVLQNIENGNFDFDLPDVYKRGFIRIYAHFLRLDPAAIMTEYTRLSANLARKEPKGGHLGRIAADLSVGAPAAPSENIESRYDDEKADLNSSTAPLPIDTKPAGVGERSPYIKIGAIAAAFALLVIILVIVFGGGSSASEEIANPELSSTPAAPAASGVVTAETVDASQKAAAGSYEFTIVALADTYALLYAESNLVKPLFGGNLQAGQRKTFTVSEPVILDLIDAERVKLERNGKPVNLNNQKGHKKFKIGVPKE